MNNGSSAAFSVDHLTIGTNCPCDFFDEHGVLLIASDVEVTDSLINKLRAQGVSTLHPKRPPKSAAGGSFSRDSRQRKCRQTPHLEAISFTYDAARVQRIRRQFRAGERALQQLAEAVNQNRVTDIRKVHPHVDDYINELADDPDPIVANSLKYESDLELAHRSVQFSVLSLAIALRMGFTSEALRDIGTAALIHDWGLFQLPPDSRFPHQVMDSATRSQYVRHPLAAVEMLECVDAVTPAVKTMVAQVHEVLDGTGFPNRLKADQLPLNSRILSVADAYLTMTSPPRDCVRIVPCDAIVYLITGASQGTYSANAVTGLLKTVTMYPIGSVVELSDTTKVRVIRSNGDDYGFPIVETLTEPSRVIDLKGADLFVTRPVNSSENNEVRLLESYASLSQVLETCQS